MKAKEYYKRICDDSSTRVLTAVLNDVHSDMIKEMENIIKVRCITRDSSRFDVLKEMDNKWKVIVRLAHGPSNDIDLRDDEFLLYVYNNVPKFKKFIHTEEIDENGNIKKREEKPLYIHKVIPFNEITNENITGEILDCMYAIGQYAQMGMPIKSLRPLAHRISLLRYWKETGIKYEQIEEFEKDSMAFISHIIKPTSYPNNMEVDI